MDLAASSARISGDLSDVTTLAFEVGVVSRSPRVLGVRGPFGRAGCRMLEQHLLYKIQLFDMINDMLIISSGYYLKIDL